MKKNIRARIFTLIILILAMGITSGCKDKEKIPPVLTTSVVTGVTSVSATCGGSVTGGCNLISAQGVCWSTGATPTIDDNKTCDEACGESFTSAIKGLTPNTTYYVRAYATNDIGTGYGSVLSFKTQQGFTVADIDGNVYNTIVIGTQTWMLENFKATKYSNGDAIANVTDSASWIGLSTGAYCNYENKAGNSATYGRLYNWFAVNDSRNIAPTGWHAATATDWATLIDYLGGKDAGGKLKEAGVTHWISPNMDADNSSGFTALPGGYRFNDGLFSRLGSNGFWWTATENNSLTAFYRKLGTDHMDCDLDTLYKVDGLSIRCLKD